MKKEKQGTRKSATKFSIIIIAISIAVGGLLSFSMYSMIQNSFFRTTLSHEKELMSLLESLGMDLLDGGFQDLKKKTEELSKENKEALLNGSAEDRRETLKALVSNEYELSYGLQTEDTFYQGEQFQSDFIAQLDLTPVWKGESVVFSPDFDAQDRYILAVAAPVWADAQHVGGVLITQLDGYCISEWLSEMYSRLELGTAYIVDSRGRNIATAREENYDWITSRYNAQELIKEKDCDENTKRIAGLEKRGLDGEVGIDTYKWQGSTNYVAYGPLKETGWGLYVGFYGSMYEQYTQKITAVSSRAAGLTLTGVLLFMIAAIVIVVRNLNNERKYSRLLLQQKGEIEQQALQIAASEERFRVAMQRSHDIIIEYQFATKGITCFYGDKEIHTGRVGDEKFRSYLVDDCDMDEDSYERFDEVMHAIDKGLTSVECILSGDHGQGRKWYKLSISAIPEGLLSATRAVGILQDITGQREAELDLLTGLLNKPAMISYIEKKLNETTKNTARAFVMLDVDYFKTVNDNCGHPAGDEVLREIAAILREVFPEPDMSARFGGDEFSVYCPGGVDRKTLEEEIKQLSGRVNQIHMQAHMSDLNGMELSVSIGAVIFHGKEQFDYIYKKADEMLYKAKEAGRGCARIYEEK